MKRKALLILAAAILAVAMIPAIGVGAATGDVKIVTPDELANPSGRTGSAFDRLTEANFVSDKTGTVPETLEDAGGTLYVVIADNDATANTLVPYNAYYTLIPTTDVRGGNLFYLDPNTTGGEDNSATPAQVTDGAGNFYGDGTGGDATALAELVVGDANRNDGLDAADIIIQTGWYVPALAAVAATEDVAATPARKAAFRSVRTVRAANAFNDVNTDKNGIFIDIDEVPALPGGTPPEDLIDGETIPATPVLRITFESAGVDVLEFGENAGSNAGKSLIEVTSSSGDPIRIPASEKDLGVYANQAAGVNAQAFEGAPSKDSGVFVARFGVIRSDFKEAMTEWEPVPGEAVDATGVVLMVGATAEAPLQSTLEVTLSVDADNVLVAGSVTATIVGGASRTAEEQIAVTGTTVPAADAEGAFDPSTGTVTVTVTTNVVTITGDVFTVNYKTQALNNNISHLRAAVDATGTADATDESDRFETFCDGAAATDETTAQYGKRCAEVLLLSTAIDAHRDNLGLNDADDATMLLNALIGVEHGDTLSVRYSDQSPRSVRVDSAEVDLVGPTIGGFTLADGAYIDEDDFEVLFDVTDADSGIFEDSHDIAEAQIKAGLAYVSQKFVVTVGEAQSGDPLDTAELDVDDELDDGERYELTIDVTASAEAAEGTDDADPVTVRVKVTITAYDAARNVSTKTVNYVVDTIDPEIQKAITGWGVNSRSGKSYVLVENQRDRIALVFDDTVQGDLVDAQDVLVPGSIVLRVTWLSNTGNNKIDVGETSEGAGSAMDLDFNAKTATSGTADDVVDDLGLEENTNKQDARHILFLTLDEPLPTDATPTVEIDNNDLIDLAGNENRADHRSISEDRLAPSFEITVGQKLSNNTLAVTIVASEELDRRPRANIKLGEDTITVVPSDNGNNNYSVDTNRAGLGIGSSGSQNGVWTFGVTGIDGNDNVGTASAKWELDSQANAGDAPGRRGGPDAALTAHRLEVNDIVFLTVEFDGEAGEYDSDSSKTVDVTALTLETLAAGDISAKNVAKARSARTIEATADVGAMSAQSNDSVRHVVALADLEQGNYNLKVDYVDAAGNTGSFDYIFQVIAPRPAKIDITPGWTLISIPGRPQNPAIEAVFEKSAVTEVWSLNNATKAWEFARKSPVDGTWGESTLDQIVDGRGYFVRSATFDPVSVLLQRFSPQRAPPMYNITAGWNSIGYTPAGSETSIEVDGYLGALGISGWGIIRTWNTTATPPQYESYFSSGAATTGFPTDGDDGPAIVEAGKGYLLFATRAGSIGG